MTADAGDETPFERIERKYRKARKGKATLDWVARCPDILRTAIIKERERRGWSESELARQACLPQNRVNEYLAGKREMTTDNVNRLLRVLSLTVRPIKP